MRSRFDIRAAAALAAAALFTLLARAAAGEPYVPRTRVSISGGYWHLDGKVTYEGSRAEGLLLNVRMVNATFHDRNPATRKADFDPDANTAEFIAAIPDYAAHGVRAFTLCLQGGMPGYEGALNSVYEPDGSLRKDDLRRVERAIEACDAAGCAVILGCFYQRQDQVLRDAAAVRNAVVSTALWIKEKGYTNVLLEIANEHDHGGFDHEEIKDPERCAGLIRLARETHDSLLVSASGLGNGRVQHLVGSASSFLLIHFNGTSVDQIPDRVGQASKLSKPIVCNEDAKTGAEGARAAEAAVREMCSWGYMNEPLNQHYPFEFRGAKDDPEVYAAFAKLSAPRR